MHGKSEITHFENLKKTRIKKPLHIFKCQVAVPGIWIELTKPQIWGYLRFEEISKLRVAYTRGNLRQP